MRALLLVSAGVAAMIAASGCSSKPNNNTGGGGQGGSGGDPVDDPVSSYPTIAEVQKLGVSGTCSVNNGSCHNDRAYPELSTLSDLVGLVGAPCQVGIQDPAATLAACEIPGDKLFTGTVEIEIWHVAVAETEPYPPKKVTLTLANAPSGVDVATAAIRRQSPSLQKPLAGATVTPGMAPNTVVIDLSAVTDASLASWLDVRAWRGDRVRMGDPNQDGQAHNAPVPWAEIVPGDPSRSLVYQRLIKDTYGPQMPLLPRTWSASATRALWCWIRGLPVDATPATIDRNAPINYDDCPVDPEAPDPNAAGGWPSVQKLVQAKCATSACHSTEAHAAGLDLTPNPTSFTKNVINVPSSQVPSSLRVSPGQPTSSYLICKVDPACEGREPGSAIMPNSGMNLSDNEIKTLRDWVQKGAPLN